jgi:hypothetical protein
MRIDCSGDDGISQTNFIASKSAGGNVKPMRGF